LETIAEEGEKINCSNSRTKYNRKVSTVCEYFRRSAEAEISCMRAVFPNSLASHRRQYEKSRECLRIVLCV
jgi:hypothetical protein